jgi:hypothetical protein
MNAFAEAANKMHRGEMAALSVVAVTERCDALEKLLAKIEARLARIEALTNPGPPSPAPATDPSPKA